MSVLQHINCYNLWPYSPNQPLSWHIDMTCFGPCNTYSIESNDTVHVPVARYQNPLFIKVTDAHKAIIIKDLLPFNPQLKHIGLKQTKTVGLILWVGISAIPVLVLFNSVFYQLCCQNKTLTGPTLWLFWGERTHSNLDSY